MKKLASTARATVATAVSRKLTRATFAGSLRISACYPDDRNGIQLH